MDKHALVNALNGDLAGELQAVIMYITYSAQVKGPHRPQLVQFMQGEIPDEQGHAQFLADKIVALGGVPTTTPKPVPAANDATQMLENIRDAERQAIADYSARAEQAKAAGELGLAVQLETMVLDETGHYEEARKLLGE